MDRSPSEGDDFPKIQTDRKNQKLQRWRTLNPGFLTPNLEHLT